MPAIICPHCGVSNREGSNFCNNCGTALRPLEQDPRRDQSEIETDATARDEGASSPLDVESQSATPTERDASAAELSVQQPWLTPEDDEDEGEDGDERRHTDGGSVQAEVMDRNAATQAADRAQPPSDRLLGGVQGLLEPHTITMTTTASPSSAALQTPLDIAAQTEAHLPAAEWRLLRRILVEEPQVARTPQPLEPHSSVSLRLPLLFLLLGIGLIVPIMLRIPVPVGAPHVWPGVSAAYAAIQTAPENRDVLVFWAYDPATAGEMDRVAQPVLTHLLARGHRLRLASPLPGGLATARRLLTRIQAEGDLRFIMPPLEIGYLPGGAAVLPLLAEGEHAAFLPNAATVAAENTPDVPIDFAVVVAARAEFVQHYLEQVHPLNGLPVIAVTSASADPVLRPYWNSGQLDGLISGFDGGSAYWLLLDDAADTAARDVPAAGAAFSQIDESSIVLTQAERLQLRQQLVFQNWGHILFLLIIIGGNVALFLNRGRLDASDDQ